MSDTQDSDDGTYRSPLADIDGMAEVEMACTIGEEDTELCDGWNETVELDAPAEHDADEDRIHLPGFEWECPECGNPHDFIVEGIWVSNLV